MASEALITVLVADSHLLLADALALALDEVDGISVERARPASALDAVKTAAEVKPHVVLLGDGLAGMDPHAVAAAIRARSPSTRVVLVTRGHDLESSGAVVLGGGVIVIPWDLPLRSVVRLVEGIGRVGEWRDPPALADGGHWDSMTIADFRSPGDGRALDRVAELSLRQLEVLQLLGAGEATREIANQLGITVGTVNNHVHAMLRRLRVGSKVEAIAIARRAGFVGPSANSIPAAPKGCGRPGAGSVQVSAFDPAGVTVTVAAPRLLGDSLIDALNAVPGVHAFDCCPDSGPAAVEQVLNHRPGVALIDHRFPRGFDGSEATRLILREWPTANVLVLVPTASAEQIAAAFGAGAAGVVPYSMPVDRLVTGIGEAAAGVRPVNALETIELLGSLERDHVAARALERELAETPPIERDVLALLNNGASPKQIARRLGLPVATVKGRIERFRLRTAARSQLEALSKASDGGLLPRRTPIAVVLRSCDSGRARYETN